MRVAARLVVLALAATGLAATPGTSAAGPEASPSVLMVGDSAMRGMTAAGQDILRADYDLTFDAGGCRRLIEPSCLPIPNSLEVIRSNPGRDVIVVMAGYNDWYVADAVDVIMGEATAQGVSQVIWLTYRTDIAEGAQKPIAFADVFREHNVELAQKAPLHPTLTVLDWDGYSAGHDDWFIWDGFHLSELGGVVMAQYLKATIDGFGLSRCAPVVASGTPAGVPANLPPSAADPGGLSLVGARRMLDTRAGGGDDLETPLGAGRFLSVPASGFLPPGATSAFVNVAAVDPCREGFLTAYPCGAVPLASNVNFVRRQTVANMAAVMLGPGGELCVYSSAQTDVVVDLVGALAPGGLGYNAVPSTRLVDTRTTASVVLPMQPFTVRTAGNAGVPAGARAAAINLTAVDPFGNGYVVAYPCGSVPGVSTLNFGAGHNVANLTIVELAADGNVCFVASAPTHLVVDVVGWFGPTGQQFSATMPTRLVDTRVSARASEGRVISVATSETILLNVTAVNPTAAGYLSAYPCGPRPLVSTLNYDAGQVVPNLAPVAPGADGQACVFLQQPGDVVIDQLGVFVPLAGVS
jgi:hypothetical protein